MPRALSPPRLEAGPGGVYFIKWTEPGPKGARGRSRRASTGAKDMAEAQRFFAHFLLMEREQPVPGQTHTIGELWELYDTKHVQTKVVASERAGYAWANLKGTFSSLRPSDVTDDIVSKYTTDRQSGKIGRPATSSTVRRELGLLVACLNWCADGKRKVISKADVPDIELPAHGEPSDRWLTMDEIRKLFAAAETLRPKDAADRMTRGERFLWLALETSKRMSAVCELTWQRVDFETKVLHFDVPGRKKTKKRRGSVPISETLLPVLERMLRERDPADGDFVVGGGQGVWRMVQVIAKRAGLAGVNPKVLRHTAATHMARRGIPLWIIAKILGNTLEMVERVYAKHAPDDLRKGVDTITGGTVEMGK